MQGEVARKIHILFLQIGFKVLQPDAKRTFAMETAIFLQEQGAPVDPI